MGLLLSCFMVINMGKYTVYAYDAEIELGGETYSVLLGIEEEGHPSHAYDDSWCDNKIVPSSSSSPVLSSASSASVM